MANFILFDSLRVSTSNSSFSIFVSKTSASSSTFTIYLVNSFCCFFLPITEGVGSYFSSSSTTSSPSSTTSSPSPSSYTSSSG
jgi:hypothetical protein